jgi:uncharacterized protein YjbI with pentapeptide repeats
VGKTFLYSCCAILMLFSVSVNAYAKPDLDKLLKTKKCQEGALTEAKLINANLQDAYLICSNLARADLTKANLHGACLIGANLAAADLIETNLSESVLVGANLFWADLTSSDLTEASLKGANISGANFTDATFKNTIWIDGKIYDKNPWKHQGLDEFYKRKIKKNDTEIEAE